MYLYQTRNAGNGKYTRRSDNNIREWQSERCKVWEKERRERESLRRKCLMTSRWQQRQKRILCADCVQRRTENGWMIQRKKRTQKAKERQKNPWVDFQCDMHPNAIALLLSLFHWRLLPVCREKPFNTCFIYNDIIGKIPYYIMHAMCLLCVAWEWFSQGMNAPLLSHTPALAVVAVESPQMPSHILSCSIFFLFIHNIFVLPLLNVQEQMLYSIELFNRMETFFSISINHLSFTLIWHDKTLGCCSHIFFSRSLLALRYSPFHCYYRRLCVFLLSNPLVTAVRTHFARRLCYSHKNCIHTSPLCSMP